MSPKRTGKTSKQPSPAGDISDADVHDLDVSADPSELFEGAQSISSASDAHERSSRTSDVCSERLDRLEGLLEGMAQQQTKFLANQLKTQEELKRRAVVPPTPPPPPRTHSTGRAPSRTSSARDRRMRLGSMDAPSHTAAPAPPRMPLQYQPQQQMPTPPPQQPPQPQVQTPPAAQQDVAPNDSG
ncbi:hypothetical protein PF004_g13354 [Phytophthora fragariae]|uniref:Uncharacterized protein n=1 Tax=Phytophthora fragariae TaxID=53985 RepID=A0A6A3LT33_9STRA|nr:hypothetical protein PF011_g4486 [Phytophthora fragariae]KAE9220382.1 hypothetical protein PF004_g13354 [Phytophthora fragariae]